MPLSMPIEDSLKGKMEACSNLAELIKNKLSHNNFRESIDKFKLRLKEVAKQT